MVPVLAFSLQDELEKYGAYAGAVAFLGLAILSLLYFAQARELKRLRDWAGRAPERAQEMEARVVAQAEEARRVPAPAAPRTVGPAQPIPKPPVAAPPVPAAGNGRPDAKPALVPMGPRPAVATAGARTAEAVAVPVVAWPGVEAPEAEPEETADEPATEVAAAAPPAGTDEVPAATDGASDEAAAPATADEAEEEEEAEAPEEAAEEPVANGKPTAPPQPDQISPSPIPRATPLPQRTPPPAPEPRPEPAAAALRAQSSTRGVPPRRPTTPPGRRPAPPRRDEGGSSAARMALFGVLGVIVLVGAVFGLTRVLGGEEDPAPPPNTAVDPGGGPAANGAGRQAAEARPETVVVVLNGTTIDGLASGARTDLIERGYSDEEGMIRTGDNVDQQRQDSVVLFPEGQRRQARDVGAILDIEQVESIDVDTQELADLTDVTGRDLTAEVVVVLGADRAP